jgi:hypothetical protein
MALQRRSSGGGGALAQPPPSPVVSLADKRDLATPDYPFKRWTRKRRKEAPRTALGDLAAFLADWEPLHQIAATLAHWQPGDRGRPPDLPPAAMIIFGVICAECHNSDRAAQAELRRRDTWDAVRELVARYPEYRGLRPGAQSISRREFWRFREMYGINNDIIEGLRDALRQNTSSLAKGMGMFNPNADP